LGWIGGVKNLMLLRFAILLGLGVMVGYAQSVKEVRRIAKQGESALPQLQHFLLNDDVRVRVEAVRGIIDIGGPHTVDALVDATRDNDAQVQTMAVNGLVNVYLPGYMKTGLYAPLQRITSDIKAGFTDPDNEIIDAYIIVRPAVIQAIGRVAKSGASLDARADAARAVGILRGKAAVPDLVEALRSRDSEVILESLNAMEKIRDPAVCPAIHFLVKDFDERVQTEALEANGVLGCKDARADIREVLGRTDRDKVRRAALGALALMPEASDRAIFNTYVSSGDERQRTAAAEGYARLASIEDARHMQALYEAETRNAPRLALAFAMVMDGNLSLEEFAPLRFLVYSLNSNNLRTASQSYLLEAARNPEVRSALVRMLDEGTRDEKVFLARVIAATGDRSNIPVLDKLSRDPDATVAAEGVRQLRNLHARI
jgi:HEAT repeat protein